jgi:hypothetical protein
MSTWILYKGETQLALIKQIGADFNVYIGEFKPYPAFYPYHHLLIKSYELLEAQDFYLVNL